MSAAIQNSNKSSEIGSSNHRNRADNFLKNSEQDQGVFAPQQGVYNHFSVNMNQHQIQRKDSRSDMQKCLTASCTASKQSSLHPKSNDNNHIEKEQIHSDKLISKMAKNQFEKSKVKSYTDIHQDNDAQVNKKTNQGNSKFLVSFYGRRYFFGKRSMSIGQQGKQQMVAFLGLFLPIVCFILYEVQYPEGLINQSKGQSWVISVSVCTFLSFALFIYCSLSNPGFVAVPLTQKQRHTLPIVQQKGTKEFDLRYCYTCHIFRPLRTHHCKICDLCVIERDHHCPFLNNCIGSQNRRGYVYFLLMLVVEELLIISECLFQIIYPFVEDDDFVETIQRIPVILAILQCIYASILAANVLSLLIFQFQLIAKNRTTDEFRRLIVPEPKQIDVELNQEYDYGCLSNFKNVLIYSRPPEPIYANFEKLDQQYLVKRFTYYKKKEKVLHEEEEEEELNEKYLGNNVKGNVLHSNHTHHPLKLENNQNITNNHQQNLTQFQSKPSFSPQKDGIYTLDQPPQYFPSTIKDDKEDSERISQTEMNNNNNNNTNNTNNKKIEKDEQSPKDFNNHNNNNNKNNESNNNNNINNLNYQSINNFSSTKNGQIINNNLPQVSNNFPVPPLILSRLKSKEHREQLELHDNSDNEEQADDFISIKIDMTDYNSIPIDFDPKQSQLKGQIERQNQQTLTGTRIVKTDANDIENQKQESVIQMTKINKNNELQMLNLDSKLNKQPQSKFSSAEQIQEVNTPVRGRHQLTKFSNQNTQEFDSNLIIYDLKPLEDSQIQQNQKRPTVSTAISKSQYYSTKVSEINSQNMLVSNGCTPINMRHESFGQNKRDSQQMNFNNILCDDDENDDLNDIPGDDDNKNENELNSSYLEQKPNDHNGIKNLQNNNNQASSRRFNGIKKLHSEIIKQEPFQKDDSSPATKSKYMNPNRKLKNGGLNGSQPNQQNPYQSDQSSVTQIYQDKENGGKEFSMTQAITSAVKTSAFKGTNNFSLEEIWKHQNGIYFDPSYDQSTDLPISMNDQHHIHQHSSGEKNPVTFLVQKEQNDQDDFNIPSMQKNKINSLPARPEGPKRNRKLFQNIQKQLQTVGGSINNSLISTDIHSIDNHNQIVNNNSLYEDQNHQYSNQQPNAFNTQIQMQPISKNFKLSPTYTKKKYL